MIQRNNMMSAHRLSDVRHSNCKLRGPFIPVRRASLAAVIRSMSVGGSRFLSLCLELLGIAAHSRLLSAYRLPQTRRQSKHDHLAVIRLTMTALFLAATIRSPYWRDRDRDTRDASLRPLWVAYSDAAALSFWRRAATPTSGATS